MTRHTHPWPQRLASRFERALLISICLTLTVGLRETPAHAQRAGLFFRGATHSLRIVRYDLDVRITHPVARTTLTQEFENPTQRDQEAFFYYPVPPDATVDGLALWVAGVRRPARILERQKAREIYQGIVNQKRDPAIVERLAGNIFRIRIFPVPAGRRTRVQLSFSQPVARRGPGRYALRLRKPPGDPVDALRLGLSLHASTPLASATLKGHEGSLCHQSSAYVLPQGAQKHRFGQDIVLEYQLPDDRRDKLTSIATTDGPRTRTFVAELPRHDVAVAPHIALLVDTSASMAAHLPRLGTIVTRLLGTLPETAQVKLIPFDYLPRPLGALSHMAPATPARQRAFDDALRALQPDRGSAFSTVFELAQVDAPSHIVLITDGATAGHQAELEHVLRGLVDHPGAAVSVLLVAPKAPTADLLRDLCRVSGGRFLPVDTDTTLSTLTLARLARLAPPPHPSTAQGPLEIIRVDTDSLLVAGQAPRDARHVKIAIDATHHLRLDLPKSPGDPAATSSTSRAPRSLWAAARIDSLFRQIKLFGESQTLRRRIVALSKTNRVASEYTAFLVTETDADYKRPTSGRLWQRKVHRVADNIPPHFNATPEPHEWALIALGLLLIAIMSRRRDALNS